MSDSVRPHRRKPTRLPHPWDSPGKNTGVGCHFLFQCMKVKSESEVTQSCPTLSNPMDCSLPGSFIHGIFQARVLEWGAVAFFDPSFRESKLRPQLAQAGMYVVCRIAGLLWKVYCCRHGRAARGCLCLATCGECFPPTVAVIKSL